MKFAQGRLPSPLKERHAPLIQQMNEELQKMEADYPDLNVEQIRERVGSPTREVLSVIGSGC